MITESIGADKKAINSKINKKRMVCVFVCWFHHKLIIISRYYCPLTGKISKSCIEVFQQLKMKTNSNILLVHYL